MRRPLLAAGEVRRVLQRFRGAKGPRIGFLSHGPCRGRVQAHGCASVAAGSVCVCVCTRVHRGAGVDRGCACGQCVWPRVEGPLWEPAVCTAMPWPAREAAASWGSSGEADPRTGPRDPQAVQSLRPRLAGASRQAALLRGLWVPLQGRCWVWLGGMSSSSRRPGVPGGRMTLSDASGDGGSIGACTSGAPSLLCSWSVGCWAAGIPERALGAGTLPRRLRCGSWVPGEQRAAGGVGGWPGVCPGVRPVFSGHPSNRPRACSGGRERLGGSVTVALEETLGWKQPRASLALPLLPLTLVLSAAAEPPGWRGVPSA